jgi:transcriptional regulator PpsR
MAAEQSGRIERLSELAPELASTVVRVAGDIALVIGDDGVIRSVAEGNVPLQQDGQDWVGRPWVDTVSETTRRKVEMLLREAQQHGVSQRRELNHPTTGGTDIPVSWAVVRLGDSGPTLAVGRDLRAVSAIQQKFLDAQQELEREFWRRRHAESRYRQLFQVAQDAVLVLEAEGLEVLEANPAAGDLFATPLQALVGGPLDRWIDPAMRASLDELLITARASGRAAEVRLRVAGTGLPVDLSVTPFRADEQHCLLLRARRAAASADDSQAVLDYIGHTPDAVVVTDTVGRVLWANPSFVELCQAPTEARLRGRHLADALGGDPTQWSTLLARVRTRGIVGQATVVLRASGSVATMAGVSAALLAEGDQEHIGLSLRPMAPLAAPVGSAKELAQDMTQLVGRLGQLSLPELVAEASRVAEVHFIQAALRTVGGRLGEAAVLLGEDAPALRQHMARLGLTPSAQEGPEGESPRVN